MQWARLQTDLNINIAVRRGAWYRVRRIGALAAVIEVRGQPVEVPRPFLEISERPPRTWTVVARPRDAVRLPARWGERYAVCPACRARQPIVGRPRRMKCPACRGEFDVGWKEAADAARGGRARVASRGRRSSGPARTLTIEWRVPLARVQAAARWLGCALGAAWTLWSDHMEALARAAERAIGAVRAASAKRLDLPPLVQRLATGLRGVRTRTPPAVAICMGRLRSWLARSATPGAGRPPPAV